MEEYIPENNLVVLLLLFLLSGSLYYFWWIARVSRLFGDDPVINIILSIFAPIVWPMYILLKYMHRSEVLNGRDMKWFMIFFIPLAPVIIQHNINEKFFPGR